MQLLILLLHFILSNPIGINQVILTDLNGKATQIQLENGKKGTVIYFLSPECPLCQSYSLTIQQLEQEYTKKGFQFIAVIPGKDYSKTEVIEFRDHYKLKSIPFLFDQNLALVNYTKASITPEVIVFKPNGDKAYQGRIDNWAYELARKRKVITEHDLKNVLSNLDQNKPVKFYQTKAVGCFIN